LYNDPPGLAAGIDSVAQIFDCVVVQGQQFRRCPGIHQADGLRVADLLVQAQRLGGVLELAVTQVA
jgi:hypothetical protein